MNISVSFAFQEFAAALKHLKPGKAPGPDSICPELITHAGAALKSWLCGFLSFCLCHLKIHKVWRRTLVLTIPKPKEPVKPAETRKAIVSSPWSASLIRSLKGSYTLVLSRLLTRFYPESRLGSDGEGQPWIRLFCSPKTSRIRLRPRKRLVPCLSI